MKRTPPSRGVSKPHLFFDRKVQHTHTTRLLSMGKIIPATWNYVRITPLKRTRSRITIEIRKLKVVENHAPTTPNNKRSEPQPPRPGTPSGN